METVRVIKYQRIRDGGTTEYRDAHNRKYFVLAPVYDRPGIYSDVPWKGIGDEGWKDILLNDIQLVIVGSF